MRLVYIFSALVCFQISLNAQNIDSLFQKVETRLKSYAEHDTLEMHSISKQMKCDKHWNVEKTTFIEKIVTVSENYEKVHVITAYEEEKKRKDITEEVRKKLQKNLDKKREHREDASEDEEDETEDKKEMSLSLSAMLPDSAERKLYSFSVVKDTVIDDRNAVCILAETDVETDTLFEGLYYFDRELADLLLLDLKPTKNPKMVKSMRMYMQFTVLPGDYFVIKRMRMQVCASILVKTWWMIIEEEHSNFQVIKKRNTESFELE